ncbi:MAG: GWxTD domain-containing protein [Bacteroidetes bacterium]|nr:GWxTD domain-containing protein [Bacteroidota bacterium]
MKKLLFSILILLPFYLSAQSGASSGDFEFYLDISRFYDFQVNKTIVEFYLGVNAHSIKFKKEDDDKYQASVNISWFLQKLENGDSVGVLSDSYVLGYADQLRPSDTTDVAQLIPLFHMQKIDLDPGTYLLTGVAYDMLAPVTRKITAINEFIVEPMADDKIMFSDVKWVAAEKDRVRTRDDLIPMVTGDLFVNQDKLVYYQEIYNTAAVYDKPFIIRSNILQGNQVLWNYENTQDRTPAASRRNAFKTEFEIDKLASNTYFLQTEVLDRKNKPIATYRKKFFVVNTRVSNEFDNIIVDSESDIFNEYTEEQLSYYLKTLIHTSTEQEAAFIKALDNYEQKKNFLYSFFEKRKKDPSQEVSALWNGHLLALDYVNQQYKSTFREGWQTDRGRVFLKYGIPQDVERFPAEANLIPYEIWRYNRLGAQTNVIFIFFDQDLSSNEYVLLHSTKYGEVNNPRWREQLRNKGLTPGSVDYEQFDPLNNRIDSKLNPDGTRRN